MNHDRKAARFRRQFASPEFVEFVHSLGCCVPGCRATEIEAAHVKKRSRGERVTWQGVVPLCVWQHHPEQEGRTAAFEQEHGIDLEDVAAVVAMRWKIITKEG